MMALGRSFACGTGVVVCNVVAVGPTVVGVLVDEWGPGCSAFAFGQFELPFLFGNQ